MRKYQSISVYKSTSLKGINRRKNSGLTSEDLERAVIRGEFKDSELPHFTKEEILEIEKQLDDAYRKAFNIIGCNRTYEVENLRTIFDE